jgi:hypothetical protein
LGVWRRADVATGARQTGGNNGDGVNDRSPAAKDGIAIPSDQFQPQGCGHFGFFPSAAASESIARAGQGAAIVPMAPKRQE